MGGVLILVSITVSCLLWANLSNRYLWPVLFTTLAFGVIGWVDDYLKLSRKNPKGLAARNSEPPGATPTRLTGSRRLCRMARGRR